MRQKNVTANDIANKASNSSIISRVVLLSVSIGMLVLLAVFGTTALSDNNGLFEIKAFSSADGDLTISLSNDRSFKDPTVHLESNSNFRMNNISWTTLPKDINNIDGSHNGENYFAHTFYVKNTSDVTIDVNLNLNILETFKDADEAMWIRLYINDNVESYAKKNKNGEAEYTNIPFYNENKAISKKIENVDSSEIVKVTVVIWLEGDDPDCLDFLKGGYVRFSMDLRAIENN